jgi:hypothetical protein
MMNPIRTWSQAVRSIIVGLELIVLAAALHLSSQPAAPVEPAQPVTMTQEATYRVYSNQDGIYLQPQGMPGGIQLIKFHSSGCVVRLHLNDEIKFTGRLHPSMPGNIFSFATSELQISGDQVWDATLQFDDWKLDFNTICELIGGDVP